MVLISLDVYNIVNDYYGYHNTYTEGTIAIAMGIRHVAKFVLFLAAIITLPACCTKSALYPRGKQTPTEKIEETTVAMVEVISKGTDDLIPTQVLHVYCTGVWISHSEFVTAHHCVADAGKSSDRKEAEDLGFEFPDWDPVGQEILFAVHSDVNDENTAVGTYRHAVVEAIDKFDDLALVKVNDRPSIASIALGTGINNHPVARLARGDYVHEGDYLTVVGHTRGLLWSCMPGLVGAIRTRQNFSGNLVKSIQVSAPVYYGDSGGGAWNAEGELLGIASYINKVPNVGFFVHIDVVRDFLTKNNVSID